MGELGFHVLDSKMEGSIGRVELAAANASVEKFFADSQGYARLIFSTDPSSEIKSRATHTNHSDLARLKQLTSSDVLLITDAELGRGIDYRAAAGTTGIALFVMSASKSKRAYEQLLGRVGRYREPCLRYVWDELDDGVDILAQATMLGKLRIHRTTRRHGK